MAPMFDRAGRLASAIAIALAATGLEAATLTVDSPDDNAASMACNLRNALKAINDGSTVSVPTCSAAVSGDPFGSNDTIEFATDSGISTITLTQGALAVSASSVTIRGTGQTIDAAGYSSVLVVGDGATLAANSLYLIGGHSATDGGGIWIGVGATAIFSDCSISGNLATNAGGALYAAPSSTLTLIDSIVSGNSAVTGGALFANDSAVTVTNSQVGYSAASARGGGIYEAFGTLSLDTATINHNTSQSYGGGIVVVYGALTATNSIVSRNSGGRAGGIFLSASTGAIGTSTISDNTAVCGKFCAGGISVAGSSLGVSDSTISGNFAAGRANYVAGGVNLSFSSATFANSTITGNLGAGNAQAGGAFWEVHGHYGGGGLTLINSTVSSNTAAVLDGAVAGGVLLSAGVGLSPPIETASKLTLQNTILSENTPADTDIVFDAYSSTLSAAYSLIGSAQNISAFNDPADHNIFSDSPGLGPLQDNGGPTMTRALLPGSPALRTGSSSLAVFASQPLSFDQRGPGYVRTFSGSVDIGAIEDQGDRLFASGLDSAP